MNHSLIALTLVCTATLVACNKPATETQPTASQSAQLGDQALDQAPILVKEDFEAQAAATITDDNLDDQVAQLETQINNDK
jgi:hypothetical protein